MHLPLLGRKLENMKIDDWLPLNRQVLGVICFSLSRTVAFNEVNETTIVGINLSVLFGMYEKPYANNKVHLMMKIINLKMSENSGAAKHLNNFNTVVS